MPTTLLIASALNWFPTDDREETVDFPVLRLVILDSFVAAINDARASTALLDINPCLCMGTQRVDHHLTCNATPL